MKRILTVILFLLIAQFSWSSHLRGGEITFECLRQGSNMGKLVFTVKLYRACGSGNAGAPTSVSVTNPLYGTYGGTSTITCTRVAQIDISPSCDGNSYIRCGVSGTEGSLAYEENVYVSSPVQINGTPVTTGSSFYYTLCCRASSVNSTSSSSYYLRTIMYPYTDEYNVVRSMGSSTNGPTCYDSSPKFAEVAPYVHSIGKDNYFSIKSFDPDCDSLAYFSSVPQTSATAGISYKTGFSAAFSLGNNSSNVPLSYNVKNGDAYHLTYGSNGLYHIGHQVSSYKDQQLVAKIYRDFTIILASHGSDSLSQVNVNPTISYKNNADPTFSSTYLDTFDIEDSVHIQIRAEDLDMLNGTDMQSVSLRLIPDPALDGIFNPHGCVFNTCATVDTNTAFWNGSAFKDTSVVIADFKWKIDCEHLFKCSNSPSQDGIYNYYNFSVFAQDNHCLIPLTSVSNFTIIVRDTGKVQSRLKSIEFADTTANIKWEKFKGASFRAYYLYKADSLYSTYNLFDSVTNINDTSYTDVYDFSTWGEEYYRVVAYNDPACRSFNNIAASIVLNIDTSNMIRELQWNGFVYADSIPDGFYVVEFNDGSGWTMADTIQHSGGMHSWTDNVAICSPEAKFRIRGYDTNNDMIYLSNVDSLWTFDTLFTYTHEICDGDSILLAGEYRKQSGIYSYLQNNAIGCPVRHTYDLTANSTYTFTNPQVEICRGDSILIGNTYQREAGNYEVFYQSKHGCDSIRKTTVLVRSIDTSITISGNNQLLANHIGASYQWVSCPGMTPVSNGMARIYFPSTAGSYAVIISDSQCVDTSSCINMDYVGFDNNSMKNSIRIYPNPANDVLIFDSHGEDRIYLEMYSEAGNKVHQTTFIGKQEIDISALADGLYFIRVMPENSEAFSGKVLIQH